MTSATGRTLRRLDRLKKATRFIIHAERTLSAVWPFCLWLFFFFGLWLLRAQDMTGVDPRLLAVIFYIGGLWLLWRGFHTLHAASADDIDRRLENTAGLRHRPLAQIDDRPANLRNDADRDLWRDHLRQVTASIGHLRLPGSIPVLARLDPRALRLLVVLFLIIGFAVAGRESGTRLHHGLWPWQRVSAETAKPPQDVTIQITPPPYTTLPVIVASGGRSKTPVIIPAGSKIKARVHGGWFTPYLSFGQTRLPLRKSGDDWQVEADAVAGKSLVISQGLLRRADIAYAFRPARPPSILLQGPPETLDKGQWRFTVKLRDDYGIADLILHMRLDPAITHAPIGKPVDEDRKLLIFSGKAQTIRPVFDLSWHSWAGLPVILTLEARNHEGLSATSVPVRATIPLRAFRRPLARAIVACRRDLIWTPEQSAIVTAYKLEQLLDDPASFGGAVGAFLSLRSASSRLYYAPRLDAAREDVPLLWDIAVTLEDGAMPFAAKDLRQAAEKLQKLLADPDATPGQIKDAVDAMREALGKYLTELVRRIQRNMMAAGMQPLSQDEINQIVRPDEIAAFLDEMQAKAVKGDRMAAQQMLAQLNKMTDATDQTNSTAPPKDMQFMAEAAEKTQAMIEAQKALLQQTRDAKSADDLARAVGPQDGLRGDLEKLLARANETLGQAPRSLQDAGQAMRLSSLALARAGQATSLQQQAKAIDALQQGADAMRSQMRARLKQMMMALSGRKSDPMGHDTGEENGNGLSSGAVKLPEQGPRRQVQDILRTLRQRSGELTRPDYERDYYQRLMEQY